MKWKGSEKKTGYADNGIGLTGWIVLIFWCIVVFVGFIYPIIILIYDNLKRCFH